MDLSDLGSFPDRSNLQPTLWAPVLLRPIMSSPETYVIGVVAASKAEFHLERANRLDRLACFYDNAAAAAQLVADAALDALESDLTERGQEALIGFQAVFSGVGLGEVQSSEARSTRDAAVTWLAALSSLYSTNAAGQGPDVEHAFAELGDNDNGDRGTDRLPSLVLEYVANRQPSLVSFFNSDIRNDGRRRRRNIHAVLIDFAGSHLVANFGTLSAMNYATSIDRLKRRLWDLKIDRDKELSGLSVRRHELLVFRPQADDPSLSDRQHQRIADALGALEEQADQEELRLRPLSSVSEIAQHVLQLEAA